MAVDNDNKLATKVTADIKTAKEMVQEKAW
jgi:hypothetical protein